MSDHNSSLSSRVLIELCVDSVSSVEIASRAGVDRIELNAGYEVGGLTPSLGMLIEARNSTTVPIIAMLRPRAGGFHYDDIDARVMRRDAELLLSHNADGLAFGFLKEDRTIDIDRCRELIRHCGRAEMVFHRAFDETVNPFVAMEQLIDLGVRRILTSGQGADALEGAAVLARLVEKSAGRIEILPGSGIRAANVAALLKATRCTHVHASLRTNGSAASVDLAVVQNFVAAVREVAGAL